MKWWNRFPKKLTALVVGTAVQLLPVSQDLKEEISKLVIGFLIGQGIADAGKEKALLADKKGTGAG